MNSLLVACVDGIQSRTKARIRSIQALFVHTKSFKANAETLSPPVIVVEVLPFWKSIVLKIDMELIVREALGQIDIEVRAPVENDSLLFYPNMYCSNLCRVVIDVWGICVT